MLGSRGADGGDAPSGVPVTGLSADADGFYGTLVDDPPLPRPPQVFEDTEGRRFSLADRPPGEVTALFVGYTPCPDACPTDMADLASARRLLPVDLRNRVQVAFVTEDPTRDTPGTLRRWLDQFDPSFVGLMGGTTASRRMAEALYLPPAEVRQETPAGGSDGHAGSGAGATKRRTHQPSSRWGAYSAEHSAAVYVFGPGDEAVLYSTGAAPNEYAADFAKLAELERGPCRLAMRRFLMPRSLSRPPKGSAATNLDGSAAERATRQGQRRAT